MDIALVACSKNKRSGAHPAHLLYSSELFKRAYWYASQNHERVLILSAKHGVVEPCEVVTEYDVTLAVLGAQARKEWAMRAGAMIWRITTPKSHITFYCGRLYREHLVPLLGSMMCQVPLAHMGIGQQLHWYAQRGYHP